MFLCMRTTIDLNDELHNEVRKRAREEGISMRKLFERALRRQLSQNRTERGSYRLRWRTEHGELRPGVDLSDRKSLLELMEGRR
ncbi:MAG: ribbon-helix-helix protein, CopG family [Polyangia bacterium]